MGELRKGYVGALVTTICASTDFLFAPHEGIVAH